MEILMILGVVAMCIVGLCLVRERASGRKSENYNAKEIKEKFQQLNRMAANVKI